MEPTEELTEKDIAAIRAEEQESVFEGKPPVEDEPPVEDPPEEVPEEPPAEADPWEGVNPELKKQFESLQSEVSVIGNLQDRLKQAENRVGSLTNELFNSQQVIKKAEEERANAPTPEELLAKKETEDKWAAIKEEEPDLAEMLEARLALEGKAPDPTELVTKLEEEIQQLKQGVGEFVTQEAVVGIKEELKLGLAHPDWETTKDSEDFTNFIAGRPDLHDLTSSVFAKDAIKVLDEFKAFKKPSKSPAEIAAEREERLEQSETIKGQPSRPAVSPDDMTDEEYRKQAMEEVWDDD